MKNEPAFPKIKTKQALKDSSSSGNAYGDVYSEGGLTKREYFAAKAMQGILSNPAWAEGLSGNIPMPVPQETARLSIELADALIKQLETATP